MSRDVSKSYPEYDGWGVPLGGSKKRPQVRSMLVIHQGALGDFILALPSLHEGLPNSLLEAMAAGLPVVASAVGGVPEQVVPGQTGLLVPPGDPQALAGALNRLLEDQQQAARMGCAGRARVERDFSLAEMVRRTEQLYAALLAEKGLAG